MSLKPLHDYFLGQLATKLEGWQFVPSHRHFRRSRGAVTHYVHVSFINHQFDFDALIDVSVEFTKGRSRLCIIGAELGHIEGCGQSRFPVSSEASAKQSAGYAFECFVRVGAPFLERFSNPTETLRVLSAGGPEARLTSPLQVVREQAIQAMRSLVNAA